MSAPKPTYAVKASGLRKRFKTGRSYIEVLKGVDFEALLGEVTMVMGPSGSGKSTLVANLSGLLRPDGGRVEALGVNMWGPAEKWVEERDGPSPNIKGLTPTKLDKFRLDNCGFIFQGFNLFAALSALQQVTTVLKYQGVPPGEAHERAKEALTEVGLGHRLNQRPSELSGGEKQRVAIARALAKRPRLLFADEPTSALDGENGQIVTKLLQRAAKEHGAAVICVTHDPRLEAFADRIIHIEDGLILSDSRTSNAEAPKTGHGANLIGA
ncbi:ABC transporter ATP-binding protein [Caulobacter sp. NIBR2454]|uniref:ABC transporter ATP-binding protein n=1 Tax=Caulobacter sp. NIBR2454 TaxID=3015996 RepID=UPI0022B71C18|nr:ABC transporter ATP-binding protein [Caulobacter sp. NIBR2454]